MSRPVPSREELIAMMKSKVDEARASLRAAAEVLPLDAEQRAEYERVMAALDELEQRIQQLR